MKGKKTLCALCSVACLAAVIGAVSVKTGAAAETLTMESTGDAFTLLEESYTAEESFVYTATANFVNGQAAGLVFGAEDNENYWVFNVDRIENRVKLMYFDENEETGAFTATVLLEDWFIGNDKITESERRIVGEKLKDVPSVQLKMIVTAEDDGVYAEFFADNIKRFGVDNDILLNSFTEETETANAVYDGGALGYNCFAAKVDFTETYIGESDYSYYTEIYRQQYHFSQYAHWNNDPNGLVYYDGYYHLYYQHHPYSNYWNDMYWGHARSKDLAHWELLPICLFPDEDWGSGRGYMWSGSAMVYHKGMSDAIDAQNWYVNGNGDGLLAFYTRDGGMQDQVIMSSDDGGMTWTKRKLIEQTIATAPQYTWKTDCRDPKVFPVQKDGDKVTLWGMALTGMATGDIWFLKSTNLLDWSYAGGFKGFTNDPKINFRAECPDVVFLTADDGSTRAVLSLTGREYLVGNIEYDTANGRIKFINVNGVDVSTLAPEQIGYQRMEFGTDSYATQSYYIDDPESEYYGKTVSLSWFSGIPSSEISIESGALAALRKTWNGGGMTIPVEWGLKKSGDKYLLTQTPIVKNSTAFEKTESFKTAEEITVNENSENILKNVNGRRYELTATVYNPNGEDVAIRVGVGANEYTEIGWTAKDGYYVDRTHTSDGGLKMSNYNVKYKSGAVSGDTQTFYILVDDGSVEAFCDDFAYPFYTLTFISPYSTGLEFIAGGEVTVKNLTVNEIASVWNQGGGDETMLRVDKETVEMDTTITTETEVMAFATSGGEISYSIESGEDIIALEETATGVKILAKNRGKAVVKVVCGNAEKTVEVTVYGGKKDFDITFQKDGVISGTWLMTTDGLIGSQSAGDGFILSSDSGADFRYSAEFDLGGGAAAAILFRAAADMSNYYIANYDNNSNIVKLWTPYGELANVYVGAIDTTAIMLSVVAQGNKITVALNGKTVVDLVDERENAPTEGLFGLNVCATRAVFKSVSIFEEEYVYQGGNLTVKGPAEQAVTAVYNKTLGNVKVPMAYCTYSGRNLTVAEEYFAILPNTGVYEFTVVGVRSSYEIYVTVNALPTVTLADLEIPFGGNAVWFIANRAVTEVKVNGVLLNADGYKVENYRLTVFGEAFTAGGNTVEIDGEIVTVTAVKMPEQAKVQTGGCGSSLQGIALCGLPMLAFAFRRKREKDNGNDD